MQVEKNFWCHNTKITSKNEFEQLPIKLLYFHQQFQWKTNKTYFKISNMCND